MDLLEHADARPLLDDADLSADAVGSCAETLEAFLARYLPHFTQARATRPRPHRPPRQAQRAGA